MTKAILCNFHVPLPPDLYDRLRKEAEQSRKPATEIGRQAIEDYLEKRRKDALCSAIRDYATRHAGTTVDLDDELESASLENLSSTDEEEVT